MVSQAELRKRRVKASKQRTHEVEVASPAAQRRKRWLTFGIAVLAFALIAPLAAGLVATFQDDEIDTTTDVPELPLETIPPSLVDPGFEGGTLTGDTPCPATDGTQDRITSFETAPSGCLDAGAAYAATLRTIEGEVTVELDASAAPEASDLFVSLARYGVYEGAPITSFDGLSVIGGFGDVGFAIPATEAPADGVYPVGSVVMLTELGSGLLAGQFVVVTSELGGEALAADATSPIIGSVTDGIDALTSIGDLQVENPATQYRLRAAEVLQTDG